MIGHSMQSTADLLQKIERVRQKKPTTLALRPPQTTQLTFWSEGVRCAPNATLRSALFNARNRKQPRIYLKNEAIAIVGEGRITYTGEELRQDDQTVWLQLIHLAREYPAGRVVKFTPYSFCISTGWAICGKSYERLRNCLTRMQATSLAVCSKQLAEGVSLSMIPIFLWKDEGTGKPLPHYQVTIAPALVELFGDTHYTRIEWEQRLALSDGIATWLHGYFASHQKPHPLKLETIKRGAGITTERKDHLKEKIVQALDALASVGFLKAWEITGSLVKVERT